MKKIWNLISMFTLLSVFCLMITGCSSEPASGWKIMCATADKKPVEDVRMQICSDTLCYLVTTDASGTALFDGEEESYHFEVVGIPDGYQISGEVPSDISSKNRTIAIMFETE